MGGHNRAHLGKIWSRVISAPIQAGAQGVAIIMANEALVSISALTAKCDSHKMEVRDLCRN